MKRLVALALSLSLLVALAPVAGSAGVRQVTAGTTIQASVAAYQTTYGHFSIRSTKPSSVTVQTNISWPPGTTAGWHYHPGATYLIVQSGTLTFYRQTAHGCSRTDYHAGQAAFEAAGQVHNVVNRTHKSVKAAIVQIGIALGASAVIPATQPAKCPSL